MMMVTLTVVVIVVLLLLECFSEAKRYFDATAVQQPFRVVILSTQHSGTHFVGSTLAKQPGSIYYAELCIPTYFPALIGMDCITRIKYMLAYPEVDYDEIDDDRWKSFFPDCKNSEKASHCALDKVSKASSIVMNLQQDQGWKYSDFLKEFMSTWKRYRADYGIETKLILLFRTNSIAHYIAQSAMKSVTTPDPEPRVVSLDAVMRFRRAIIPPYEQFYNLYPAEPSSLAVAYEHLLKHSETFYAIARFIGFTQVDFIDVPDTKHHTNQTGTYLKNFLEIRHDIRALRYPDLQECMLTDDCGPAFPSFCSNSSLLCYI